jgi:hypothetical protein
MAREKFIFRRFSYAVIYRVVDVTIQVVAVAHGRRRPGYWYPSGFYTRFIAAIAHPLVHTGIISRCSNLVFGNGP